MTPDREAFLRAIAAAPGDWAPILVYADWLDERGDPDGQAELIRHSYRYGINGTTFNFPRGEKGWAKYQSVNWTQHPSLSLEWFGGLVNGVKVSFPHWVYLAQSRVEDQPVSELFLDFSHRTPNDPREYLIGVPRGKLPFLRTVRFKRTTTVGAMGTRGRGVRGNATRVHLHENFRRRWQEAMTGEWEGVAVAWAD